MEYEQLYGLQVSDYEYPGEANAFSLLKKIPVLDKVVAAYLKCATHAFHLPEVIGDCFRVTPDTSPRVYDIYKKALKRLDITEEYPLYVKAEYDYNAYTTGGSAPFIVIHSSLLKNLSEEDILYIIGHELGHVKSGHLIYYVMAQQINTIISMIPVPGVDLVSTGIQFALIHWARMHEFTADRAGVLAAGSIEAGQKGLSCQFGIDENIPGIHMELDDLLNQNASFKETNEDLFGKIVSASMILQSNHPWTVSRIQALEEWKNSGSYDSLMSKYCG